MKDYADLLRRLREHKGSGFNRCQDAADAITELQRDAARYRWLRDQWDGTAVSELTRDGGEVMDAAIDAAMQDAP